MLKLKPLVELIYGDQVTGYYKPGTDCENNTPGVHVPEDPDIVHSSVSKSLPAGSTDEETGTQRGSVEEIKVGKTGIKTHKGKILHFKSKKARANWERVAQAYKHGWKPKKECISENIPDGYVEAGLNTEYPDIGEAIERYTHNQDTSGISDALNDINYDSYYESLQSMLKHFMGDEIKVKRKEGYAGGDARGAGEYVSVSYNPNWTGDSYTINRKDVVLAGYEAEAELIVKRDKLKPILNEMRDFFDRAGSKNIEMFFDNLHCKKTEEPNRNIKCIFDLPQGSGHVKFSVYSDHSDRPVVGLNDLYVPSKFRNNGIGSSIMKSVINASNKSGVQVELDASPTGKLGLSYKQLIKWYGKFGFKTRFSDPGNMIYRPKNLNEMQDFIDRSSQNPVSSVAGYQDELIPPFQTLRPSELFIRDLPAKKVGDFFQFLNGDVTVEMDDTGNRVIHLLSITTKSSLDKVKDVIQVLMKLADKIKVKLHMSANSDKAVNLFKTLGFKSMLNSKELIYTPKA